MRSSVINSPEIGERAKQIADERLRAIVACNCKRPDGGGLVDTSACPIHRAASPEDLLCGLGPHGTHWYELPCTLRVVPTVTTGGTVWSRKPNATDEGWGRVLPARVLP